MAMLKHVVLFRLKDDKDKEKNIEKLKEMLEALPGKIPLIRYYEVGVNAVPSDRTYDMCLISAFGSEEDLQEYRVHPAHQEVLEFYGRVKEDTAVVDYYENEIYRSQR